jgi:hypothetical protein
VLRGFSEAGLRRAFRRPVSVPIGRSPGGLPIGAQIIGPWLEDRTPLLLVGVGEPYFFI